MIYPFTRIFLGPIIRSYVRKVEGLSNLPSTPFIAAANHASYVDDFIFPYTIGYNADKKFHIFVNSRFYKNVFFKMFLDHYRCIPVDVSRDLVDKRDPSLKKSREKNEYAFQQAVNLLRTGHIFMIFPEGGRSPDGKIRKSKTGIARIALTAKVPVVPVGIKGSYEIMPKGSKFPKFRRADIIIGKPLYFDSFFGKEKDYKSLTLVTTKIMKEIAKLIGQDYKY
jgi:1-acyl-sn-glycerol-3-phosphate acyltransferase